MFSFFSRGCRRADRFTAWRGLSAAGAVLSVLAAGSPALADTVEAKVSTTNVPTIIVENNGSEYTHVLNSSHSIMGELEVKIDAEVTGRVKSFEAFPILGAVSDPDTMTSWSWFKSSGFSKSYSVPRPKSVTESFNFAITRQDYGAFMVAVCNKHADKLRSQGKKNSEIFSKNRTLAIAIDGHVDAELTGPDRINPPPSEVSQLYTIGVTCKRDDALDPVANAIKDSLLVAYTAQVNHQGACELQVSGTIVSATPSLQVKFRYHSLNGDQSDLKTVTTDSDGFVNFLHTYPLAKGSKQSGKIRMIGVSHAFMSNWADFTADCDAAPQNVATALPPRAVAVEAYETADKVMYRGLVCPAKVKVWGVIKGRGKASGAAALFAAGKLKAVKQYDIKDDETIIVEGEQELSWEGNLSGQQNVLYRMNVSNAVGDLTGHVEAAKNFECRKPQVSDAVQGAPGSYAGDVNAPKSLTLSLSTLGLKRIPGYSCPDRVRMSGNMMSGDKPLSGTVELLVNGSPVKQMPANHEPHWGHNYDTDYELAWNAATQTEQTLNFTLKFANQHGYVVKTVEKQESFACQKITTSDAVGGAPGGLSNGAKPANGQPSAGAQVGAQLALPQGFAIQAPKGTVKQGVIQLSGGQPTATYTLKFFRKSGGSATLVNSAQLPKSMKGLSASFPLAALTGGRSWRLEVCPQGQTGTACKTSDFRVAAFGVKQDATPAPQGTSFVIVPGVLK